MARARNIKPGFFTNDRLAEISPLGRLLFAGIWTIADREGRLDDRPKKIKAEVLPYDACDVERLLQDLHEVGFIRRYEAGGHRFIQVVKWSKHQNPHVKESASTIPEPDSAPIEHATRPVPEQVETGASPADSLSLDSGFLIPDSGFLIPDSGFLIPDSGFPHPDSAATAPREHDYPDDFELTFAAYPKRAGDNPKRRAFQAWKTRLKEGHSTDEIHAGVKRYAAFVRATGKENTEVVKHAATFFGPEKAFLEPWARPNGSPSSDLQPGAIEYLNRFNPDGSPKRREKEIEGDRIEPE